MPRRCCRPSASLPIRLTRRRGLDGDDGEQRSILQFGRDDDDDIASVQKFSIILSSTPTPGDIDTGQLIRIRSREWLQPAAEIAFSAGYGRFIGRVRISRADIEDLMKHRPVPPSAGARKRPRQLLAGCRRPETMPSMRKVADDTARSCSPRAKPFWLAVRLGEKAMVAPICRASRRDHQAYRVPTARKQFRSSNQGTGDTNDLSSWNV